METKDVIQRIQGALMGVALGDALGMPVETMKCAEIAALNNGQGVTGFMDPVQRKIEEMAKLKAGDTTDDWQLTEVVARSLIRMKGEFDVLDCASEHVVALVKSTFGWGRTTQIAIEEIRDRKRNLNLPPQSLGPGKGCGNGIIMKVAPLALIHPLRRRSKNLSTWCMELSRITHPDDRAGVTAYAVATLMRHCFITPIENGNHTPLLKRIIRSVEDLEITLEHSEEQVSTRLTKLYECLESAEHLRTTVGCGFHALDSAAFAIGTFLRHPTNFRVGVLEAINAGGDTDTHGSIVGALIGANCGINAIPEEWQTFNPLFAEALELGEKLFAAGRS